LATYQVQPIWSALSSSSTTVASQVSAARSRPASAWPPCRTTPASRLSSWRSRPRHL